MNKKCPYCLAEIPTEARKCMHCGEWVDKPAAESAAPAEEAKPVTPFQACPSCEFSYPDGAVLCVHCGYDARTGQKRYVRFQPPAPPQEEGQAPALAPRQHPAAPYVYVSLAIVLMIASAIWIYSIAQREGGVDLLWSWGPVAGGVALGMLLLVVFIRWWLVLSD